MSENEDLREQLKQQEEIIERLMEMKNILKTQITLENEIMKQNLKEQSFQINKSMDKLDEEEEEEECDSKILLSDNACLEVENNCLREIIAELSEDKDYLADHKNEKEGEEISRTADLRRLSVDSLVDERQTYKDVLEGTKQWAGHISSNRIIS